MTLKLCPLIEYQPYSRWAFSRLLTDGGGAKRFPFPKICHTHPTMMKLVQKHINHVIYPLILLYQEMEIYIAF